MRGTLIGSDYLKQGNEVKFLEINTNIAVHQGAVNWLDTGSLMAVLTGSNITEFHFIHNGNDSNARKLEVIEYKLAVELSSSCALNNISYFNHEVAQGAITVPYIEDADHKFILRQSYDNTAIIDSSYAADNFEFFDLMSGSNYSPKLFQSSSADELYLDTFDSISTSSIHPNVVIKSRYPAYDYNIYPKIGKFNDSSSIDQDIIDLKTNLPEDYLLQEFVNDPSNIVDGRWSVIRGVDILYGPTLEVLHLGGYKTTPYLDLDLIPTTFSGSSQFLDKKSKQKYNSKALLTSQELFHTDASDRILLTDGTVVSGSQLSTGDSIKTSAFSLEVGTEISASIPVFKEVDEDFRDHYGYLRNISGSIQYVSASLAGIEEKTDDIPLITINFGDGSSIIDSPRAAHLIEESGSDLVYFEYVNKFIPGDKLITLDINTNDMTPKEITSTSFSWGDGNETLYNLDVTPIDHFLNKLSGSNYLITHNACNYCGYPWAPCGSYWCDSGCSPCGGGFKPAPKY